MSSVFLATIKIIKCTCFNFYFVSAREGKTEENYLDYLQECIADKRDERKLNPGKLYEVIDKHYHPYG